jgi:lysophospholipase L1-like esterase
LLFQTLGNAQNILENGIYKLYYVGCGIQNRAIRITGAGNSLSRKAYFNSEIALDEIDMNFKVVVDSLNSAGEFRFGIGKNSGNAGTMVEFKGTDSTTEVLISRLNNNSPILVLQYPLPFKISVGESYNIRVGKRIRNLVIEVASDDGEDHYLNDTLSYPDPFFGCLWGKPFIGCHSGKITVNYFNLETPLNKNARLAVWGDSFVEGNSLENVEDRYVSLIKDSIGYQNISIMGRGGETSNSISSRFWKESKWFENVKYGLIAIGVNDISFPAWKTNMIRYTDSLKKQNIIPIIATLSPRKDRLSFINQTNNWIRNTYEGAYIDISKAISFNDSVWFNGMFLIDTIHPSASGHLAIFERVKLDAPYLFRENKVFTIDYINETTLESVSNSLEYSLSSHFLVSNTGNQIIAPVIPGTTLYFRDTNYVETSSLFDILPIPPRPAAPKNAVFDSITITYNWTNNPAFPNISDYEYSSDGGINWVTCVSKPMNTIGLTDIQLRIKATASNFKSSVLQLNSLGSEIASQDNASAALKVYPNPFANKLIIENLTEKTSLTITASDGRIIKSELLIDGISTINTSDLVSGFYILTLENSVLNRKIKILKQ